MIISSAEWLGIWHNSMLGARRTYMRTFASGFKNAAAAKQAE